MKQTKKLQLVMLFTSRNSGCLTQNRHTNKLSCGGSSSSADNRHIYGLSDEPIQIGDWCIGGKKKRRIYLCDRFYGVPVDKNGDGYAKKIIFTTDNSLTYIAPEHTVNFLKSGKYNIAKPSQKWLEYFVDEYNKGNIITEVEVEYEDGLDKPLHEALHSSSSLVFNRLVINPDNTINIKYTIENDWAGILKKSPIQSIQADISFHLFMSWLIENYNPPTKR